MGEGRKDDVGKLRYDLIPPSFLREIAYILTQGAQKYGEGNWQQGLERKRLIAAAMRHMEDYRSGEVVNESDWGNHHLSHCAINCLMIMWYDIQDGVWDAPEK